MEGAGDAGKNECEGECVESGVGDGARDGA